jgi:predicted ATPase
MTDINVIKSLEIAGYRPFRKFQATLNAIEVIVGANGSGKSALFEFLRILRNGMNGEIPPGILPNAVGQQVFHLSSSDQFSWDVEFRYSNDKTLRYTGTIVGPLGRIRVAEENITVDQRSQLLSYQGLANETTVNVREPGNREERNFHPVANQLALASVNEPTMATIYGLRQYIRNWRFYNTQTINVEAIRRSILIEQEPVLKEDASNLGAVLHYLYTEHHAAFDTLQQFLRSTVPGFKSLSVKARGAPGEVLAFWTENSGHELTIADLSDGIIRLLCWGAICVHPKPPTLLCIDEPDQGVHPRTLPFLAGLLKKTASRTQILLATHSSYFLTQFDLSNIAVMRKESGEAKFFKPQDSKVLREMLADFGAEEIEALHRSDELERLS